MKYDVFISYSRKDIAVADKICEALDKAGVSYFIDRHGIGGGMEFPKVLSAAIKESELFLFLASENSYASKYTTSEITFAFNKKQKNQLLPYVIDSSSLPDDLELVFSCINIRNIKEHPIEPTLVEDILDLLGRNKANEPSDNASEPLCPCGSGKPFKDCHGKTNPLDLPTDSQADESPNEPEIVSEDEPVEAPVEAPLKTPADEPEEVPVVAPAYTPRSRNWKVGDYYNADGKEGVVFWVDQTGRYIKIVHLDHAKLAWCEYDERKVVTGAVDQYDGMKNLEVISRIPYWQSKYPAFAWCAERGAGWYLPAVEEFRKIEGLEKVNHTLRQKGGKIIDPGIFSKWLWSSTESEKDESVKEIVGNFAVYDSCKFTNAYVRAVAMIDTAQESSTIWKVGDYYNVHGKEGIVFQVDETGKHGKIVSVDEGYCRWSTVKQLRKGTATGATDKHDGMKNQQMIMEISDWHSKYPAFAWCAEHGSDWYLPAVEELKGLLQNREVYRMVDKTLSRMKYKKINSGSHAPWTWSSTEFNGRRACYISTIAKGIENTITELKCYVRAVSTF